ncbi:MAG: PDZ domain-containing protein [Acidiferrobacterales bacterium]
MEVGRVPPNTAAVHDLAPGAGAHIAKIIPRSPADQAGLESGDIILRMDYRPVSGPGSILRIAQNLQAGQSVPVQILRYGKIMQIYIVPRPRGEGPVE